MTEFIQLTPYKAKQFFQTHRIIRWQAVYISEENDLTICIEYEGKQDILGRPITES